MAQRFPELRHFADAECALNPDDATVFVVCDLHSFSPLCGGSVPFPPPLIHIG